MLINLEILSSGIKSLVKSICMLGGMLQILQDGFVLCSNTGFIEIT